LRALALAMLLGACAHAPRPPRATTATTIAPTIVPTVTTTAATTATTTATTSAAESAPDAPPLGTTREAAVEVCGVGEEYATLRLMRCHDRSVPAAKRRGVVGERTPFEKGEPLPPIDLMMSGAPLPPGARDHHIVDLFEVRCPNEATTRIYMDLYHCPVAR
jgi:hypothetical protein